MDNLNYDSFYKFLTSLGLLLLVLLFIIIGFLCGDSFNLTVSQEELEKCTDTARSVIELKQSMPLLMEQPWFPVAMGGCFIIGILLIFFGMKAWLRNQKIDDKNKQLDLDERVKNMSPEQVVAKNAAEAFQEESEHQCINSKVDQQQYVVESPVIRDNVQSKLERYLLIEDAFYKWVCKEYPTYDVRKNIRIGQLEYDVIAFSKKFLDKDYIFEIKYYSGGISRKQLEKVVDRMRKQQEMFCKEINHLPCMVLVMVATEEQYGHTIQIASELDNRDDFIVRVYRENELIEQ